MSVIVLKEQWSCIFIRYSSFSICSCFHLKYIFYFEVFLHVFVEIFISCFWSIKLSCIRTLLVTCKIMGVGNSSLDFMPTISWLKFGLYMFDLQSSLPKFFVKLIFALLFWFHVSNMYQYFFNVKHHIIITFSLINRFGYLFTREEGPRCQDHPTMNVRISSNHYKCHKWNEAKAMDCV